MAEEKKSFVGKGAMDYEQIKEISDINDSNLKNLEVKSVLVLAMSTFPFSCKLTKNSYTYTDANGTRYEVSGYSQLEPIPKLLKEMNQMPELILILASKEAKTKKTFTQVVGEKEILRKGSAVAFFKEQIDNIIPGITNFKTIELDRIDDRKEDNLPLEDETWGPVNKTAKNRPWAIWKPVVYKKERAAAVNDVVEIIRGLHRNPKNSNMKLYMDIHGGKRQDQIVLEAVINLLDIEGIEIEKAFSIAGIKQPIEDVTDHMHIFQLVSAITEFTNFGQGNGISKYVEKLGESKNIELKEEYQNIADGIRNISEALLLCRVEEFENALDQLGKAIEQYEQSEKSKHMRSTSDYLGIFIGSIKNDYGDLLDRKKRETNSLNMEIEWAYRKGYLQQCLAIIEAKTPEYFTTHICGIKVANPDERCKIWNERCKIWRKVTEQNGTKSKKKEGEIKATDFFDKIEKIKWLYINKDCEALAGMLLVKDDVDLKQNTMLVKGYKAPFDKECYNAEIACGLNITQKEAFLEFIKIWRAIKGIRNNVFHLNEDIRVEEWEKDSSDDCEDDCEYVGSCIQSFIASLSALEDGITPGNRT